jgi:ATP-binding cassette subfamily B protein
VIYLEPIIVLIDVIFELSMPLLMSRIVDVGIASQDVHYIARIGLYMVLLALTAMVFGILNMWLANVGSMGFGANLRDALFEKVQQFSFTNIDHFSTASLVTRLTNDVNNLQLTLMMALRILLRAPMILVVAFLLAYDINAELAVVLAVAIPLLVAGVALVIRTATRRFAIVQERIDALNNTLQENLIGQRVVKAFVRADFETEKFQTSNDALTQAFIRAVSIVIWNMPLMMLILNGATLAIIWLGGHLLFAGTLGAGELIGFLSYVFQILNSIMMISMVFVMYARAQASGRRVLEVLETPVDIVDKPMLAAQAALPPSERGSGVPTPQRGYGVPTPQRGSGVPTPQRGYGVPTPQRGYGVPTPQRGYGVPTPQRGYGVPTPQRGYGVPTPQRGYGVPTVSAGKVEFRDVAFKYSRADTGEEVLSGISFTAEPGEVVAVVGGTGSGKSTLVNLIPRLYDVSAGAVLVDGSDVRDYALDTLRGAIGVVLQRNTLFSGTILENLLWGREDAPEAEVEAACRDAQAHDFIMSLPRGYDTELGQGGVNLSGGQKQRLCIARAILKQPKILILDDSTSAVDSATEACIRESFDQHLAQTTIFIIAQRISSVRNADKIVVLDDGKVIGIGTHQSLLATNVVYQEINQSQQEGGLAQ